MPKKIFSSIHKLFINGYRVFKEVLFEKTVRPGAITNSGSAEKFSAYRFISLRKTFKKLFASTKQETPINGLFRQAAKN